MELDVHLTRAIDECWGFELVGGADCGIPLTIVKVQPCSPAHKAGLQDTDTILQLNGEDISDFKYDDARRAVAECSDTLDLLIARGLYDPVLDDSDPVIDLQPEDFDQPSTPPTEVFQIQSFEPIIELENRSLTGSPFVTPTKPYRPFSTEPLEVPPLEDPIILNPDYRDEFRLNNIEDDVFSSLFGDLNVEAKYKLPINAKYDPNANEKLIKQEEILNNIALLEQSIYKQNETNSIQKSTQKDVSIDGRSSILDVKDTKVHDTAKQETGFQSFNKTTKDFNNIHSTESYKKENISNVFKSEELTSVEKITREDLEVQNIDVTAKLIVEDSINRAVSVAEQINKEMSLELRTSTDDSKATTESKSKEINEKTSFSSSESELIETKSEKCRTESENTSANITQELLLEDNRRNEERKQLIKREIQETIESGSVKQRSEIFETDSNAKHSKREKVESKTTKATFENDTRERAEHFTQGASKKESTRNRHETSEQRVYSIGLQTIPNIRGTVNTSHHYDLLLKTFFIHLTDVMVALSRFMLAQPASHSEETSNRYNSEHSESKSYHTNQENESNRKEQNIKKAFEKKERRDREDYESVIENKNDKKFVEKKQETIKTETKTGAKMSQLSEKKTEALTHKMDAVISEFQTKSSSQEHLDISSDRRSRSRSRSRIEEEVMSDSDPLDWLDKYDSRRSSFNETTNTFSRTEAMKTESKHESRKTKVFKPKDGKQTYLAVVEAHVYTNKDAILEDYAAEISETASVQSAEEINIAKESMESMSVENVVMSSLDNMKCENAVVSMENNLSSAKKETVSTMAVAETKELSTEVQETKVLNSEQIVSETAQTTLEEKYSSAQKTSVQSMAVAKSNELNIELSETNAFESLKVEKSEAKMLSTEELSTVQMAETKSMALAKSEELITETDETEVIEKQELKTEVASSIFEEDYTQTALVNETKTKQNTDVTVDEKLTLKNIPEKTLDEQSAALKIVKYQVAGEGESVHMTDDTEIQIREEFELKKLQDTVEESISSETYSKHEAMKSSYSSESKVTSSEISISETESSNITSQTTKTEATSTSHAELSKLSVSKVSKTESDISIQNADTKLLNTQLSIENDENNNASTPTTVPATPLTDEYMFTLEIPLPKNITPIPREISPEVDEDPHIVKKRLIPHIETTIESIIYDPPLPTPEEKPTSPVYSKPGLKGGNRNVMEEIREIERKSSLLASAIDETIKSIEEYKESIGMEKTEFTSIKTESKSEEFNFKREEHSKLVTNGHNDIKMNGFSNSDDILDFSGNTSCGNEENTEKSRTLENSKESVEIFNTESIQKEVFSSEESNIKVAQNIIVNSEQIAENGIAIDIDKHKTNGMAESEKEIQKDDTAIKEKVSIASEEVIPPAISADKIERRIENYVRPRDIEETKVILPEIDKSWESEELVGFRPVHFDPDADKGSRSGTFAVQEPVLEERRRTYMTPDGEILGTVQGIVDGLEEATVDDEVAKELGKPGMPEEKIAELISGEAEMLREAHVMGLTRVLSSHMHRPDDSSVDFHKIKPIVESLKDSEVLKALNEEILRTRDERKKKEDKKWTTFLQKPKRPVPRVKFGYYGYVEKEEEEEEQSYKVQIVKQPKPKVAPDYKPEDFETGPLPWEERAALEPALPPVAPEEPILVPEETPEFLEAVDPLPESEVPDLEDTGIPLPEPTPILLEEQTEEDNPIQAEEEIVEQEEESNQAAEVIETTEEEQRMEQNRIAEQLLGNIQNMIDPNAPLEQQMAQMRQQLAALAQLPGVIQQTLENVSRQFNQLSQMESLRMSSESRMTESCEIVSSEVTEQVQNLEVSEAVEDRHEVTPEPSVIVEEEPPTPVAETNGEVMIVPAAGEVENMRQEEEMRKIEKQKKVEMESRMVKQRATPRVGKPKRVFGPLSPEERPIVLPGGRKWRGPKDAYNEQMFAETLQAQAELIQGKALGSFESELLPYDQRINFMKYEKPPVSLDHLQRSEVLRMIQNQDDPPRKRVELLTPVIAEADYRERVRSMTPNSARGVHFNLPEQLEP